MSYNDFTREIYIFKSVCIQTIKKIKKIATECILWIDAPRGKCYK